MFDVSLVDYAQQNQMESKPRGYLEIYEGHFAPMRARDVRLLEFGVAKGKSMAMWRDYFPHGIIAGVDLYPEADIDDPRVRIYSGAQNDTSLLDKVAAECAPDGFDIIIDDAAHIGELAKASFWHMFEHHLKPGGFYAIEDWGTGYWGNHLLYPDGDYFRARPDNGFLHWLAKKVIAKAPVEWPQLGLVGRLLRRYQYTRAFPSHQYGMVGFVKQLIDEIGIAEITNPQHGVRHDRGDRQRWSRFVDILITPGVVLVRKA